MEVLILCLVAITTVLVLWYVKFAASFLRPQNRKRLPPGPWTLPVIGSLHHVISTLPHHTLADLSRRHGPLMLLRLGEIPTVVASSAEAAELIMKTHDLVFADRAHSVTLDIFSSGGIGFAFAPYGDHWRQVRKTCVTALLSAKQVKRIDVIRAQEVGKLLHSITTAAQEGAVINLTRKFSALSNNISSCAIFGERFSQQDAFLHAMDKVMVLMGGFALVDLFPSSRLVRWFSNGEHEMKKSIVHIQGIISEIIRERARDGASTDNEDVLDALLRLWKEDLVTAETIGVVILELFAAATHSSATILGWAISELFNNPNVMAKAQSEVRQVLGPDQGVITNTDVIKLRFMQMVIKEALRTHPPSPLLVPRETRDDCNIMGYDIPKGTTVSINVFAIFRDPRYWESPEEFKPERFENNNIDYYGTHFAFTPFGAGRRICPGILFGASTVEICLANLLYHFNWVHPSRAGAKSLDMSEKYGIATGRRFDLELIATPHVPSAAT